MSLQKMGLIMITGFVLVLAGILGFGWDHVAVACLGVVLGLVLITRHRRVH